MSTDRVIRFVLASLLGGLCAYPAVGFLSAFYREATTFILLSLLAVPLFQFFVFFILELISSAPVDWRRNRVGLFVLLLTGGLTLAAVRLCLQFPSLFDRRLLFMDSASLPVFAGAVLISAATLALLVIFLARRGALERLTMSRLGIWIRGNLPGLSLAFLFFLAYLALAETINFPGHRTLDQYFDLDISAWLARLQAPSPRDITDVVRAVHPAVLLFLRPPVWIVSLLLNGDRLHAVFVVHALAAAACVFLTWKIVKRISSHSSYALIFAALLGTSASHLVLGSMLETYIYSAFALLLFVSILQTEDIPFTSVVLGGIVVFGITVTNLAQTVILYFARRPRIGALVRYCVLVVGAVLLLNVIQAHFYPAAQRISPGALLGEQRYQVNLTEKPWLLTGRLALMLRAVLLYGIVAPKPFVLTEELGVNVPNFRTFQITIGEFHVAGYTGLADVVVKLWMAIFAAALLFFLWDWFQSRRPVFAAALLACLAFNFALHVLYGDDPLLYSPDWVYAVVSFMAFSFQRFAGRGGFYALSIFFLASMAAINLGLLRQIMEVSAPFYGR